MAYLDATGVHAFGNAAYEQAFGLPPGGSRGRPLHDLFGPAGYEAVGGHVEAALRGEARSFPARLSAPGTNGREARMSLAPHAAPDGRLAGVCVLFEDETPRSVAEERLRLLFETTPDAVVTFAPGGTVQSANPAADLMFRSPAAALIGRPVAGLIPALAGGGPGRRDAVAVRADGTRFPVEVAVGESDRFGLAVAVIRDATRRRELEREVLEVATREQRRIGVVLHDQVGQELTGLGLRLDVLARQLGTADEGTADMIAKIVAGLQRVYADVRALAAGLVPAEAEPAGLQAALAHLTGRVDEQFGVRCTFEADGPDPGVDAATAGHLLRITQEAVFNALRHARPGSITVSLRTAPGELDLEIRDDGARIADPPPAGGLGLRLMQYRAGQIGGTLTVGPAPEGGTRVACRLAVTGRGP
jgi:signal transduction histidine kinase